MIAPGGLTATTADRPGLSYYVPGLRVAALGANLQAAGEVGTQLPDDVLGDLMRAEITRVNTGLSQYTLTFNNWYLSTARDRNAFQDRFAALGARETTDPSTGSPTWPRFKYEDFTLLAFGQRLRVDMRYLPEPTGGPRDPDAAEHAWTPMVAGPVTDMRFSFASGQGAQLTVSGEDDLSRLKDKQERRVTLDRRAEVDIVRQLLGRVEYPLTLASPLVDRPAFTTDNSQGIQEALQSGQSPLELIQKLCDRLDFEVFLEFDSLDDATSAERFHFEPYRGRAQPDVAGTFRLDRERNLLSFTPTIKIVDQYSKAEVKGRHRDPLLAHEVLGTATHEIIADELHIDPAVDGPLASGPELRDHFFPGRQSIFPVQNQSNLDEVRADTYAKAVLRKKAREVFTIEVTTLGLPRLRPGRFLEIRGMRPPFDGFYYVTKTVHTYGTDGFRTRVTAERPGMELPPYRVASGAGGGA